MMKLVFTVSAALSLSLQGAETAAALAFKILDRDHDGKIVASEVERSPWVERLDTDHDGGVSPAELAHGWDEHPVLRSALAKRFPRILGYPEPEAANPSKSADASPRQGVVTLRATEHGVGSRISDIALTSLDGRAVRISQAGEKKALVIACVSTSCPIGKRYIATLAALEKEYAAKGVAFIFLATTKTDTDAELLATGLAGPIVRDTADSAAMRALGVLSKTDCFVIDARQTLQYRGAVDDQYGLGYSLDAARTKLLAAALDATLAGRTPDIAATEAPGCIIDLADAPPPKSSDVTYHNTISRLLAANCTECHHPGGVAPFSLETIEDVAEHAGMIRKMVDQRLMPPWFAAPPAAGKHTPWANDRSLSEKDRANLLGWLAAGRPAGDPKDAPLPRLRDQSEWAIGKPDAIFQIPEPITVAATGTMPYQTARIATRYTETKWVSAVEVMPTARDVVHHVLVFADGPGGLLNKVLNRNGDETGGFFAIYVPGNNTLVYPSGYAKALPAGSTLRFQIHYTPNGREVREQVRIGLRFAPGKPEYVVENAGISTHRFAIPPGDGNCRVDATLPVPRDARILGFLPHMHLRGKAWRYTVRTPDGNTETLLDVPRYDFNWQLLYRYSEPRLLPAGSVIQASGWFDNSAANPANPDPTKTVKWGPQTTDEMMLGYVEYFLPK